MVPSDPRRFARNKASSTPPRALPARAPKASPARPTAPSRPAGASKPAAAKPSGQKRPAAARPKPAAKPAAARPAKRPTKAVRSAQRSALKAAAKALEPKAPVAVPAPAPAAKAPRPRKARPAKAAPVAAPAPVVVVPPAPVPPVASPAPSAPAPGALASLASEDLLLRIVALIRERRGEDVVALDVRGLADYMDFLLVATGRSDRQNRAIADGVMRGLRGLKVRPLKRPEPEDGAWICLDFVDVVVHIFDGITRAHYDLENLWGDAPRFPLPEAAPLSAPQTPTVG